MKAFLASVVTTLTLAAGAMYSLEAVLQRQADHAFISPASVRLPA